jgi:hypothetical protein
VTFPTVALEMQFSGSAGAWTNVAADVLTEPGIALSYGISGAGPDDRVADTGTLNFSLNNAHTNSGAKQGYYAPGHANARAGFELGIGVRLALTYSGSTFYKFNGRLDTITPDAGRYLARQTHCTAVDWIDEAARHRLNRVAIQIGQRADQVIAAVVGNMTRPPVASTLATAQQEWPYALDTAFDESTTVLAELQRVAKTDRGFIVIRGNTASGGELRFYDRRARMNAAAASTALSDDMVRLRVTRPRALAYNRIKATAHPRLVETAATTILYTLFGQPTIAPCSTLILEGRFTDPSLRAVRVGAASLITPVANSDYFFGTSASDTSLTASLSVAASFGANTVRFALTNSASQTGVLSQLRARGAGIFDYSPETYQVEDAALSACLGGTLYEFDLPYEFRGQTASAIGDYELSQWKSPLNVADDCAFVGTNDPTLLVAGLRREPGDVVSITETATGVAHHFYIQSCRLRLSGRNYAEFAWGLMRRTDLTDYWVLDVDKLGVTAADNTSAYAVLAL